MVKSENASIVKKGIFALAVVAVLGSSTAAFAVVNNQPSSTPNAGYGTDGAVANAAMTRLIDQFNVESTEFQADVDALAATARTDLAGVGASEQADIFLAKFDTANNEYNAKLSAAQTNFRATVAAAANNAVSKDQFIDAFNRAKAEYMNQMDVAKNDFAAVVSNLGDNANQAKDRFIGGYNSTRDAYGNQLEVIKNDFAATLG
jgi:hypothetical protein